MATATLYVTRSNSCVFRHRFAPPTSCVRRVKSCHHFVVSCCVPLPCAVMADELLLDTQSDECGWLGSLKWVRTSMSALQAAEKRVLAYLRTTYTGRYVDIGNRVGNKDNKIWTISLNEKSPNVPLVLIHGFASGVGLWVLNLDALAANRPVYAFDLLGFGRSSRPNFASDPIEVETQLIDSIEHWRNEMKLNKFILLGHSLGGFLATAYTLRYPDRVCHLILADPWGFPERPPIDNRTTQVPIWVKAVFTMLQPFNPLSALRAAGPWGPKLVEKLRPDLTQKFSTVTEDDADSIPNYIYHCNAQTPSGEAAFKTMTEQFGWAKFPMLNRVGGLREDLPLTILYGSRSWIDHTPGYKMQQLRNNVDLQVITDAGHHIYADKAETFNEYVCRACHEVDGSDMVANTSDESSPNSLTSPMVNDISLSSSIQTSNESNSTVSPDQDMQERHIT